MLKEHPDMDLDFRRKHIMDLDFTLLEKAKAMIVAKMDGWENSQGVKREIEFCEMKKKQIFYFEINELLDQKILFNEVLQIR